MVRRLSGQELEENHSEGVDIAASAERLPEDLLGARVRRGEHSSSPFRHGALRRGRFHREQLCDAEVQQPDVAFCRDKDVGGLEVAVEHEVRVRELDGGQHLVEQRDACPDVEASPVGERGDRLTVDHFHGEVGLALRRDTGIVQARDVGVLQASEMSRSRENRAARSQGRGLLNGNLSATSRWKPPSARRATHTSPIPPAPSGRSRTYGPTVCPATAPRPA